jgi:hypothetical protein
VRMLLGDHGVTYAHLRCARCAKQLQHEFLRRCSIKFQLGGEARFWGDS